MEMALHGPYLYSLSQFYNNVQLPHNKQEILHSLESWSPLLILADAQSFLDNISPFIN